MTRFEQRYTEDHEAWLKVVEKAEGGVFSMHGFTAYNPSAPPTSERRLITDQRVVEEAVGRLRDEFGWGELAGVNGPMTTGVAVFEARSGEEPRYAGDESRPVEGGWWLRLPVDYHERFHDPERCEFRVRARGRDVALHAREFAERRAGRTSLAEFDYTVEYALVGGDVYVFNDHPDAPEATGAMIERVEGGGRRMVDIERHPVEVTPAALELLEAHGRMIAEIAAQCARDREAEGGGDVVGYFGVGEKPGEAVGARYAPDIEKIIIWRHGEMRFDTDNLAGVEDKRPGGWGPETWTG